MIPHATPTLYLAGLVKGHPILIAGSTRTHTRPLKMSLYAYPFGGSLFLFDIAFFESATYDYQRLERCDVLGCA